MNENDHQNSAFVKTVQDKSICLLGSQPIFHFWTPEHHHFFSKQFKTEILNFILSLKCIQKKNNLKFPKFILYEIIGFMDSI